MRLSIYAKRGVDKLWHFPKLTTIWLCASAVSTYLLLTLTVQRLISYTGHRPFDLRHHRPEDPWRYRVTRSATRFDRL